MHPDRATLTAPGAELEATWAAVSTAIESWKARYTEDGVLKPAISQALRESMAEEMRAYLGRGAADSLDGRPVESISARAQTMLESLLGRDAATLVLDEVFGNIRRHGFRAEASR